MSPLVLNDFVRRVADVPAVKLMRDRAYWRKFITSQQWQGLHYGIFDTFAEAQAAIPSGLRAGYALDNDWYVKSANQIEVFDYPVMYWLRRLLVPGAFVFDFGGHAAITYSKYREFIDYPQDMQWVVCEQAEVVEYARQLHAESNNPHLRFVTDFGLAEGADILLSAGCLQFVEQNLAAMLGDLREKPRHLLLNKLPLYERETKVTLQNTGRSFSPCWLFNRDDFIAPLEHIGYRVADEWNCQARAIHIPLWRQYSLNSSSGLYLTLSTH